MPTSRWAKSGGIASLLIVSAFVAPHTVRAQHLGYFHALAIPPRSVGTCIQAPTGERSDPRVLTLNTLVMTSTEPGRRREISVTVDTTGRVVGYSELGFA